MNYFYSPDISSTSAELTPEESHHAVHVLRVSKEEIIGLLDGKGNIYTGKISEISKTLKISNIQLVKKQTEESVYISVAIAPTKQIDRFEWFIEKSTEIGVSQIIPVISNRSERKSIQPERLKKIMVSAIKQSLNPFLPELLPQRKFSDLLHFPFQGNKCIATCETLEKTPFMNITKENNNVLIAIGPEGDFTPDEIKLALNNGFIPVSLGNNRFRTETAGIIATHMFKLNHN